MDCGDCSVKELAETGADVDFAKGLVDCRFRDELIGGLPMLGGVPVAMVGNVDCLKGLVD